MRRRIPDRARGTGGFSLVELLTVVAIIAIMAAVAGPAIANFIRTYRIKAAMQQVASDISAARLKAITKNVQLGVTFAIINATQYRVVIDDDLNPQAATPPAHWRTIAAEDWPTVLTMAAQAGPVQTLPGGVQFDAPTNCTGAPGTVSAADTWGIRFNRMGAVCPINLCGVPGGTISYGSYIDGPSSGTLTLCLRQQLSNTVNLRRWISLNTGGRVLVQP
jgi:prepilin-type N-terminal cleavage/methylation domain-containing protein